MVARRIAEQLFDLVSHPVGIALQLSGIMRGRLLDDVGDEFEQADFPGFIDAPYQRMHRLSMAGDFLAHPVDYGLQLIGNDVFVDGFLADGKPILEQHQVGFVLLQPVQVAGGLVAGEAFEQGVAERLRRDDLRAVGVNASLANADLVHGVHGFRNKMIMQGGRAKGLELLTGMNQHLGVIHGIPEIKWTGGVHYGKNNANRSIHQQQLLAMPDEFMKIGSMDDASPTTVPALDRDERRIRAAQDVLRTTIRDLYLGHFGRTGDEMPPMDIRLSLRITPAEQWQLTFDPPLSAQLIPQLADREAVREAFRPGRVYCFRCSSNDCGHSHPGSPLEVFKGYDEAGRPAWQELPQSMIDARDERVDLLYARPARLVAMFQYGRELKGRQLPAFGKASLSYSVLAQVVAGYFDFHGERLALSLQLVEGRDRAGGLMLKLNPVGYALADASLVEWLSLETSAVLFRAMQISGRELQRIEEMAGTARREQDHDRANQWMGRIPGVARRLAEALSRGGRQDERRTRHVEARRKEQRPVHKAREDVAAAKPESWYFDIKAETWVVVGDRGRAHAFNDEGKHVTSFMLKPAAVDYRLRIERWRRASLDEVKEVAGKV